MSMREAGILGAHVPLDLPPLHPSLCPLIHLFMKYQIQDKKVMDQGTLGFFFKQNIFYIFIHARLRINLWQKTKFINGSTANSGNQPRRTFNARLLQGTNEGGRGRGEEKTAGAFLPSHIAHIASYPTAPSPPAVLLQCVPHPVHQCPSEGFPPGCSSPGAGPNQAENVLSFSGNASE